MSHAQRDMGLGNEDDGRSGFRERSRRRKSSRDRSGRRPRTEDRHRETSRPRSRDCSRAHRRAPIQRPTSSKHRTRHERSSNPIRAGRLYTAPHVEAVDCYSKRRSKSSHGYRNRRNEATVPRVASVRNCRVKHSHDYDHMILETPRIDNGSPHRISNNSPRHISNGSPRHISSRSPISNGSPRDPKSKSTPATSRRHHQPNPPADQRRNMFNRPSSSRSSLRPSSKRSARRDRHQEAAPSRTLQTRPQRGNATAYVSARQSKRRGSDHSGSMLQLDKLRDSLPADEAPECQTARLEPDEVSFPETTPRDRTRASPPGSFFKTAPNTCRRPQSAGINLADYEFGSFRGGMKRKVKSAMLIRPSKDMCVNSADEDGDPPERPPTRQRPPPEALHLDETKRQWGVERTHAPPPGLGEIPPVPVTSAWAARPTIQNSGRRGSHDSSMKLNL